MIEMGINIVKSQIIGKRRWLSVRGESFGREALISTSEMSRQVGNKPSSDRRGREEKHEYEYANDMMQWTPSYT